VSCAIQNGAVKCWGSGAWGVIGPDTTSDTVTPTTILASGVTQIATGDVHVCAIQNEALKCWGANDHGQLGNTVGNNEDFGKNPSPTIATGLGSGVTEVAAGQYHTCAIQNGALKCFGYNAFGQLGRSDNLDPDVANPTPTTVPGLGSGVTDVVAGRSFTCAVHNGDLKCWGDGKFDQLGFTESDFETTPTRVPDVSGTIDRLSAGGGNVCIVQDRMLKCWGDNIYHQLLASTSEGSSTTPVTILQPTIGSISVGDTHICAEQNGDLYCWGDNYEGQLGTDDGVGMFDPRPPVLVTY
jgi:alpha-tubulin suppressor-like RCC1 family protein